MTDEVFQDFSEKTSPELVVLQSCLQCLRSKEEAGWQFFEAYHITCSCWIVSACKWPTLEAILPFKLIYSLERVFGVTSVAQKRKVYFLLVNYCSVRCVLWNLAWLWKTEFSHSTDYLIAEALGEPADYQYFLVYVQVDSYSEETSSPNWSNFQ